MSSDNNDPVEVDIDFAGIGTSTIAYYVDRDVQPNWVRHLPLSQIVDSDPPLSDARRYDCVTVTIPYWLALDRGLI